MTRSSLRFRLPALMVLPPLAPRAFDASLRASSAGALQRHLARRSLMMLPPRTINALGSTFARRWECTLGVNTEDTTLSFGRRSSRRTQCPAPYRLGAPPVRLPHREHKCSRHGFRTDGCRRRAGSDGKPPSPNSQKCVGFRSGNARLLVVAQSVIINVATDDRATDATISLEDDSAPVQLQMCVASNTRSICPLCPRVVVWLLRTRRRPPPVSNDRPGN